MCAMTLKSTMIPVVVLVLLYCGAAWSMPVNESDKNGDLPQNLTIGPEPHGEGYDVTVPGATVLKTSSEIDFMSRIPIAHTRSTGWQPVSIGFTGDSTEEPIAARIPYTIPWTTEKPESTAFITTTTVPITMPPLSSVFAGTLLFSPERTTPYAATSPLTTAGRYIWQWNGKGIPPPSAPFVSHPETTTWKSNGKGTSSPSVPFVSHPEMTTVTTGATAVPPMAWRLQCEISYSSG